MHYRTHFRAAKGFSLVELLMAVALISMLAAVALFNLTNITGSSRTAKARMNASSICSIYQAAKSAGVTFTSTSPEGMVDELIAGKSGSGAFAGSRFQLSMASEEKAAALALCSFDPAADAFMMKPSRE